MNIIDQIDICIIKRRADNIIRNAKRRKAMRDHFNRPHVQSDYVISYPVPRATPVPAPEYGIGPVYVVCVLLVVALVSYVNYINPEAAQQYACAQIASK